MLVLMPAWLSVARGIIPKGAPGMTATAVTDPSQLGIGRYSRNPFNP